jgi:hypothetical protein
MATTTLLRYGWEHPCLRCGPGAFARYPDRHVLSSDEALERHADALAEELRELCGVRGRMLGLLRVGTRHVVALSGRAAVPEEFHAVVEAYDASFATIAHDRYEVPARSLGGHDIRSTLLGARGLNAGRPARWPGCFCAAPKLLSYWMQERPGVRTAPGGECHLVELWCGAPTARRRHGERAWSCATCGRVLATLLCRAP